MIHEGQGGRDGTIAFKAEQGRAALCTPRAVRRVPVRFERRALSA